MLGMPEPAVLYARRSLASLLEQHQQAILIELGAVHGRYLAEALHSLRHENGSPVCELYGAHDKEVVQSSAEVGRRQEGRPMDAGKQQGSRLCLPGAAGQGPVVAFNLLRSCGAYVGYRWAAIQCVAHAESKERSAGELGA